MQQQGLPMREALHQAQLMVTGQRAWDETAWAWVSQAWGIRLDAVLQEQLTPLLAKLQGHTLAMRSDQLLAGRLITELQVNTIFANIPHWGDLSIDDAKLYGWVATLARELRSHNGQADETTLRAMVRQSYPALNQALTWPTQAPPLIAGSLAFATAVFG